jgi:hypothetical protein
MGMYVMLRAMKPDDVRGFLRGAAKMLRGDDGSKMAVSLEKAWHGLHFLLTGSAMEGEPPLGFLLEGGEAIGDDLGYGPPRFFDPEQTKELNSALAAISDDDLWRRFNPAKMSADGVYPEVWDEPESDLREEYLSYFNGMKNLVQRAVAQKLGLLVMLT